MKSFKAVSNSTIFDVCANTYGSLDHIVKLMVDNNHDGITTYPSNGQAYSYDESMTKISNSLPATGSMLSIGNDKIKYSTRK